MRSSRRPDQTRALKEVSVSSAGAYWQIGEGQKRRRGQAEERPPSSAGDAAAPSEPPSINDDVSPAAPPSSENSVRTTSPSSTEQDEGELVLHTSERARSGYSGVVCDPRYSLHYSASGWRGGKTVQLGRFATAREAAVAFARNYAENREHYEAKRQRKGSPPRTAAAARGRKRSGGGSGGARKQRAIALNEAEGEGEGEEDDGEEDDEDDEDP